VVAWLERQAHIGADWQVRPVNDMLKSKSRTVKHCWYVDPIAKTLEVLSLTGTKWLLAATFKDADPVTAPPFEVHTFPLDVLWPQDAAEPAS
jgi:hypothetical protein